MATTFLEMTNRVLRRLNEVELTSDTFANARGLHATTKDAVNDAIKHVDRHQGHWPWNATEHTLVLEPGVTEYAFPIPFRSAEWRTFQLQEDRNDNLRPTTLKFIERDVWYESLRDRDANTESSRFGTPQYVFESHGNGFGVSPTPDNNYTIKFRYYTISPRLVNALDELVIPDDWNDVIFYGALMFLHAFKENADQTTMFEVQMKEALNEMSHILLNRSEYMRDTRIHRNLNRTGFWYA